MRERGVGRPPAMPPATHRVAMRLLELESLHSVHQSLERARAQHGVVTRRGHDRRVSERNATGPAADGRRGPLRGRVLHCAEGGRGGSRRRHRRRARGPWGALRGGSDVSTREHPRFARGGGDPSRRLLVPLGARRSRRTPRAALSTAPPRVGRATARPRVRDPRGRRPAPSSATPPTPPPALSSPPLPFPSSPSFPSSPAPPALSLPRPPARLRPPLASPPPPSPRPGPLRGSGRADMTQVKFPFT